MSKNSSAAVPGSSVPGRLVSDGSVLAVAAGAPILIAALLGAVVPELDPAACALVLVLVIVAITLRGDWLADLLAVVSAAAGFDFFLTEPVHSLKIHSAADIEVHCGDAAGGRRHRRPVDVGPVARQGGRRTQPLPCRDLARGHPGGVTTGLRERPPPQPSRAFSGPTTAGGSRERRRSVTPSSAPRT
ncbi:DUF4118 domain-containing protein [Acidipropionibacterium jensenii]|uniref:DUF4118 domain-containing protein n=2 Tax=Acidipropionibacterium jensenii TaxID=1749 RepID=UPI002647698E|nr:DUF4118 domain-containing protein [Acidipropionibacterium jensenii]MDN6557193.1 DUF4118 domain-containing protein [Acidipropionibacterium acidipropionici]MDN5977744.1 DUF4118 domain-containing protein [Acidipropionibacterium jensenii]MDN5997145.1 DUF4118 domain-containing protein [Acidipropionibacterium jensenii]MDN6021348.1 DUF4118 domain-containing protein [Acidipropionibacterium jensenii]MDN6481018.1 DUF4118 domain-containing protein [Acidipropionibacterium jensenii]